jgi:hypothetical protein
MVIYICNNCINLSLGSDRGKKYYECPYFPNLRYYTIVLNISCYEMEFPVFETAVKEFLRFFHAK